MSLSTAAIGAIAAGAGFASLIFCCWFLGCHRQFWWCSCNPEERTRRRNRDQRRVGPECSRRRGSSIEYVYYGLAGAFKRGSLNHWRKQSTTQDVPPPPPRALETSAGVPPAPQA